MKRVLAVLVITIMLTSCSSKKEGNMIVEGEIKGLKKGKLYLQKIKDTLLVSVDSVAINGSSNFKLTDNIESPVVYYLTFDGNTKDKRILFFGEKGTITINDNVENFGLKPEIIGSKNQEILDQFNKIRSRFQSERLQFIKKDFDAKKANDKKLIAELEKDYNQLIKRKVLFTTNFAISNSDFEVAPYIALTEMYDASLKMLDTVNASLSPKIKASEYGKSFQDYLNTIKKNEEN